MARTTGGVRPTRRTLDDLGQSLPDLGTPLDEIDHVVVKVAQTVPERREAGGAERILALKDRVWFKVKVGDQRAVVTELADGERAEEYAPGLGNWWIGAAGRRQANTPSETFMLRSLARALPARPFQRSGCSRPSGTGSA